jgi:hypothetical protein
MNKKRLLKLADLLEKDAENKKGVKFDLMHWADTNEDDKGEIPLDCKTKACAIGLACISGAFRKEGLGWKLDIFGCLTPYYNNSYGWNAVTTFFDIPREDAEKLFAWVSYKKSKTEGAKGERAVAKRIRKFVEKGLKNKNPSV